MQWRLKTLAVASRVQSSLCSWPLPSRARGEGSRRHSAGKLEGAIAFGSGRLTPYSLPQPRFPRNWKRRLRCERRPLCWHPSDTKSVPESRGGRALRHPQLRRSKGGPGRHSGRRCFAAFQWPACRRIVRFAALPRPSPAPIQRERFRPQVREPRPSLEQQRLKRAEGRLGWPLAARGSTHLSRDLLPLRRRPTRSRPAANPRAATPAAKLGGSIASRAVSTTDGSHSHPATTCPCSERPGAGDGAR